MKEKHVRIGRNLQLSFNLNDEDGYPRLVVDIDTYKFFLMVQPGVALQQEKAYEPICEQAVFAITKLAKAGGQEMTIEQRSMIYSAAMITILLYVALDRSRNACGLTLEDLNKLASGKPVEEIIGRQIKGNPGN